MKSSSAALAPAAWIAAGVLGIAAARGPLVARYHQRLALTDAYALPAPEQAIVASLGYRSALADLIFANVLVQYGVHIQERRKFEFLGQYLDTIIALDPDFREPYRVADTLLVFQASPATVDDWKKAREVRERGLERFPFDQELWTSTGQLLAYLGHARLEQIGEVELAKEWRRDGARVLARACELVGSNEALPYHCVTAAKLLSQQGEAEAAQRFVERLLAVSDDDGVRDLATNYLGMVQGDAARRSAEARGKRFQEAWSKDLRFVSKDLLLVVGPRLATARCVGATDAERAGCYVTWRAWGAGAGARY